MIWWVWDGFSLSALGPNSWKLFHPSSRFDQTIFWIFSKFNSSWPSYAIWMASWTSVNIGSGNGLLSQRTKPLPEPMLTYQYGTATWRQSVEMLMKVITAMHVKVTHWESVTSSREQSLNSSWPSDAIWRQRSGSTLVQVMACRLTAPSHYLNQFWLIISKVQWHSSDGNFTRYASAIDHWVLVWKLLM